MEKEGRKWTAEEIKIFREAEVEYDLIENEKESLQDAWDNHGAETTDDIDGSDYERD